VSLAVAGAFVSAIIPMLAARPREVPCLPTPVLGEATMQRHPIRILGAEDAPDCVALSATRGWSTSKASWRR